MTDPRAAEFERIRGYLQQQAAQKSVAELFERVREGMNELIAVARAVPAGKLETHPPGDDWAGWEPYDWTMLNSTDNPRPTILGAEVPGEEMKEDEL